MHDNSQRLLLKSMTGRPPCNPFSPPIPIYDNPCLVLMLVETGKHLCTPTEGWAQQIIMYILFSIGS